MPLITTVAGENSDSYATLVEADTYFENHYNVSKYTAWSALSDEQKEAALKTAARMIETLPFYDQSVGRAVWNQALVFPRNIDWDNGYEIPYGVKDAQCEQAVHLLSIDETTVLAQLQGIAREEVSAGSVNYSVTYTRNTAQRSNISPMTFDLLRPYIRRSGYRYRA